MRRFGGSPILLAATILVCGLGAARAQTYVNFPDPQLEAAVRGTLGIPAGPLTADDLQALTYLYASGSQITNLSGLEYATNLATLSLPSNALSDVSVLTNLPNLQYLNLQSNHLPDAHALSDLPHLLTLNISFNSIHDAAPLLALTNLASLDVGFNPLTNYSALAGLGNLTELTLAQLSIRDPSFVNGLTNLKTLNLINNQIDTLPALPGLQGLSSLNLGYNPITNALALFSLTNLATLSLNHGPISDVSFLAALPQIENLYLQYDNLSDLSSLAGLTNLGTLMVDGNSLTNGAVLGGLTNLTMLYAISCSLTDMDFVSSLTRLRTLDLAGNRLIDVAPVLSLARLQYLFLDQNRLTSITGLDSLLTLKNVSLVQNLLDVSPGAPALAVITNLLTHGASVSYLPQNEPPTILLPPPWAMPMDRSSTLSLYFYDDVTPVSQLLVTASSGNTNLIPEDGVVLQHSGEDIVWNFTLTPSTGQTGTATLTFTATDDTGLTTTTDLTVTVYYNPQITLPDTNLEAVVRGTLGLVTGPLTAYDLQSLSYLNAAFRSITNLAGLEWATNLVTLDLSGDPAVSLGQLLALPHLQNLYLGYNKLHDLSPLQGLSTLTTLMVDGNPGVNLAAVGAMTNLVSLSASSCSLSNLAGIGALARLQSIQLGYNGVHDLQPLAALTNLVSLDLQGNPLAGTGPLAELSKLQSLTLTKCSLNSLSGLQGLTNLQYLYLDSNTIRDLAPLAGLTNLVFLGLDSNPVSNVSPLAALPRLATLNMANCSMTNLSSVQGLKELRSLYAANNGIHDLPPLPGLTNLSTLYLSGNPLTNLAALSSLPALSTLDLTSCWLSNITSLPPLTGLRSLNLAYNTINDISPLQSLTNLYSLYLTANRLTNLTGLGNLSALRWVDLTRNLLDLSASSATMTVITNLQKQGAWVNYDPQNQPPYFYSLNTNWIIRPNLPAKLQFALVDDVTRADNVALTVSCTSAGALSNSAITLVRTSFYLSTGPMPPIVLPPVVIQPPGPGPIPLDAGPGPRLGIVAYGGGVSSWELTVTPTMNQTGAMTLTLTTTDDTGLSTNAIIHVAVQPPDTVDGAVLGAANLIWQTGGNAPWFGQTNVSHSGSAAAQSGTISVNEESWLETTVTGPGILTFWWKITATNYGSYVVFKTSRGGTLVLQANADWRKEMVSVPAGECVLGWNYAAPWSASPSAACWVDDVSFAPGTPDFWVDLDPGPYSFGAGVTLHGEPGGLYELQVSTNLADWSPVNRVVFDPVNEGFTVLVGDPCATGARRFYRARQLPEDTMWFHPLWFYASGSPVLQLISQPGIACEILASTNLVNWSALTTVTNTTGTLTFTNLLADPAKQFYRAQRAP